MFEHLAADHPVKTCVSKRQAQGIGAEKLQTTLGAVVVHIGNSTRGSAQVVGGQIDTVHLDPRLEISGERVTAFTTAQIEHALTRLERPLFKIDSQHGLIRSR